MLKKARIYVTCGDLPFNKGLISDMYSFYEYVEYSDADDFLDKLDILLDKEEIPERGRNYILVYNFDLDKPIYSKTKDKAIYYFNMTDKEIILEIIKDKFFFIEEAIDNLDELLKNEASINLIQSHFKKFKEWIKAECKEYSLKKYEDTLYERWYSHLIYKIFAKDINSAKVNDSFDRIEATIYKTKMDFFSSMDAFLEYYNENCAR